MVLEAELESSGCVQLGNQNSCDIGFAAEELQPFLYRTTRQDTHYNRVLTGAGDIIIIIITWLFVVEPTVLHFDTRSLQASFDWQFVSHGELVGV